jgi:hypothetical protein
MERSRAAGNRTTTNGAASYEAGFALGGPIIKDVLGFRASLYYRRDGGFIDKVTGTPVVLNATGGAGRLAHVHQHQPLQIRRQLV